MKARSWKSASAAATSFLGGRPPSSAASFTAASPTRRPSPLLVMMAAAFAVALCLGLPSYLHSRRDDPFHVLARPPSPPSSLLSVRKAAAPSASAPSSSSSSPPSQEATQPPTTAILMVDTRDLLSPPTVPEIYQFGNEAREKHPAFWYGYLTAANNRMYACKHGYAFVFAHIQNAKEEGGEEGMADEEDPDKFVKGCRGKEGMRSAPWCKVYVLARALRMYERVVFLDSDAMVANMTMPVEDWLDTYEERGGREGGRGGGRREEEERPLYVSDDRPFREDRMNTGLMIAYSSSSSTHYFLKEWWETDPDHWARTSPFEQEVLNEAREEKRNGWKENTARLVVAPALQGPYDEGTNLVVAGYGILNPENQPIVHITNYDGHARDAYLSLIYARNRVMEDRWEEEGGEGGRKERRGRECPPPVRINVDGSSKVLTL